MAGFAEFAAAATSPDSPVLAKICEELARRAGATDATGQWPVEQLDLCRRAGALAWTVPRRWGGLEWSEAEIVRAYMKLSAACLTTTFVLTQPAGALKRLIDCGNARLQARLVPEIVSGESFASVGISHLTTSRRHVREPVLRAAPAAEGFLLDGTIPWVTGADHARYVVTGATLDDSRQILAVLPMDLDGVTVGAATRMVGLSATHTSQVACEKVRLPREWILAGPVTHVLAAGGRLAGTGGAQTSALALGVASAAISWLQAESQMRPDLASAATALADEYARVEADLLELAAGRGQHAGDQLRIRANSLVLRAPQAAMAAAKGAGYLEGHPVGRWCREALFFLVWSCPQPVASAALCDLAGTVADAAGTAR
jgi:alkylation response protein AidB-like acyl-CoA dehydrogenase